MKGLPLHHLHRLRRKLRRAMFSFHDPDTFDLQEQLRTGHRQPPPPRDPMKIAFFILLLLVIGLFILGMTSCSTVETRTTVTSPDGTVTVTESKTTAPDAGSVSALGTTALAFAPRAVIVRDEKSGNPADLRRILRGSPITRQEIAARWKPAAP